MNPRQKTEMAAGAKGFTLIELMIVVVVVGILGAVAFPAYQDHLRKGRRAAAQSYLMELGQRQQQFFIDNRGYAADAATLGYATPPSEVAPPNSTPYYTVNIAVNAGPPPTYTLTATPSGAQANDSCGTLSLNSGGTKSASSGANCW